MNKRGENQPVTDFTFKQWRQKLKAFQDDIEQYKTPADISDEDKELLSNLLDNNKEIYNDL